MSTSFRPTFIRTDRATEKLLTQEANGLALDLKFIVVSDQKFDPEPSMQAVPGALDPIQIGGVDINVDRKQKTLKFAIPVGVGDLRINAVGILDSDGELAYLWSSTHPQEQLGYKEIGSRYLQGVILKIFDAPFDSVQVVHDNSLADVDLSFADLEMQQVTGLLTTMLAVGEVSAGIRQVQQTNQALRLHLNTEVNRANHAEELLQQQHDQAMAVIQKQLNQLQQQQLNTSAFLTSQLNFNAKVHHGFGSLGTSIQQ